MERSKNGDAVDNFTEKVIDGIRNTRYFTEYRPYEKITTLLIKWIYFIMWCCKYYSDEADVIKTCVDGIVILENEHLFPDIKLNGLVYAWEASKKGLADRVTAVYDAQKHITEQFKGISND